jgi:xylulokinase
MAKLLGIDVGTSGAKALLIDESGQVLKEAMAEYPLSTPKPLWSEQNPEDWWAGVQACLAQINEPKPDAIGLTGQMHGAVFLDKDDQVIRPAILWNDQRTAEECAEIEATVGRERVMRITCNPPLTGFQAPKLLWLRNHELSNYQQLRTLLLPKDYVRLRLTGEKVTDVSDASGAGVFNVPERRWSVEIMGELEVDSSLFPECVESATITGQTREGVPVVAGGGDQAAGAVGTGAVAPGIVSVSLGTSGVVFTALERPEYDPGGASHTFCHANGAWHSMGVMLACGGALRWARDTFFAGSDYAAVIAEAERIPADEDLPTFLPYLSGERCPHNDPAARGSLSGLTLSHRRPHVARAILEGISFGLLDGMDLLRALGASGDEIRVTGGGARSHFWVQMLADVFQKPCVTLESDQGPAFGAAILAGVGVGIWADVATACAEVIKTRQRFDPQRINYSERYRKYRRLYEATREWNHL